MFWKVTFGDGWKVAVWHASRGTARFVAGELALARSPRLPYQPGKANYDDKSPHRLVSIQPYKPRSNKEAIEIIATSRAVLRYGWTPVKEEAKC